MRFLAIVLFLAMGCDSGILVTGRPDPPVDPPDTTVAGDCRECRDDCLEAFPPSRNPSGFQDCYKACLEGPCDGQ